MWPICLILAIGSLETSFCQSNAGLSGQSLGISCTTVGGPSRGKACQFPFIFGGVARSGCISDSDPEGRLWCSTRVDADGVHVGEGGHWAHCSPSCPRHNHGQINQIQFSQNFVAKTICTTSGGKSGSCLPPSSCVGVDFSDLDKETCSLPSGEAGLCCVENLKNKVVKISSDDSLPDLNVPTILSDEIDAIFKEVEEEELRETEKGINVRFGGIGGTRNQIPTNVATKKKTPSFFHHKFNAPRKEIVNYDKEARKLQKVTKRLKELKNLTDSQATIGLRSGFNSFTNPAIKSRCPWVPAPVCNKHFKYRSIDGRCNNLKNTNYGRTGTPFQRILLPDYAKRSVDLPRKRSGDARELPPAREISNKMADGLNLGDSQNTLLLMQMGQFIDHDITHTPNYADQECCRKDGKFPRSFSAEKCFPMRLSRSDPFWRGSITCMDFSRSLSSPGLKCELQNREQLNQISHWLDGSNIYGSTDEEAAKLRGVRGKLKISKHAGQTQDSLPTCNRHGKEDIEACEACEGEDKDCYYAGDLRVNEQLNLIVVHTLFMREHNRIADTFARFHPEWSDEKIFQEARRLTIAEYQHVVYKEWLPVILGNNFMRLFGILPLSSGHSFDYDDNFDPRINNEFASAAFRFGHSLVPKTFLAIDKDRAKLPRVLNMKEVFFQPKRLKAPGFFDGLIRGMTDERTKAADSDFVDDIRNHLFETSPGSGGLDLVAINIQRGRDHGLPGYNSYREICMGSRATQWSDLRKSMEPKHIEHLKKMYRSIDDVDLYVGGFLEQPHQDSLVGPVFKCIIGDQFARLKKGDRFFYDLGVDPNTSFDQRELDEIRKTSLARLICDNSDVDKVQPFVLKLPISNANAIRSCEEASIPRVNLNVFNKNNFKR